MPPPTKTKKKSTKKGGPSRISRTSVDDVTEGGGVGSQDEVDIPTTSLPPRVPRPARKCSVCHKPGHTKRNCVDRISNDLENENYNNPIVKNPTKKHDYTQFFFTDTQVEDSDDGGSSPIDDPTACFLLNTEVEIDDPTACFLPNTEVEDADDGGSLPFEYLKEQLSQKSTAVKKKDKGKAKLTTNSPPRKTSIPTKPKNPTGPSQQKFMYNDQIYPLYYPYIERIDDVEGDENCGFRVIAQAVGKERGADDWCEVRKDLYNELQNHLDPFHE